MDYCASKWTKKNVLSLYGTILHINVGFGVMTMACVTQVNFNLIPTAQYHSWPSSTVKEHICHDVFIQTKFMRDQLLMRVPQWHWLMIIFSYVYDYVLSVAADCIRQQPAVIWSVIMSESQHWGEYETQPPPLKGLRPEELQRFAELQPNLVVEGPKLFQPAAVTSEQDVWVLLFGSNPHWNVID